MCTYCQTLELHSINIRISFFFSKSGSIFSPWDFDDNINQQREMAYRLGLELGCFALDSTELLQCLQDADAIDILQKGGSVRLVTSYMVTL